MSQRSVCVIGAGIAGLVTAKVLSADGFAVTVFDAAPKLGGVCPSHHTYPGLRTNNTQFTYRFTDLPNQSSTDEHPTAPQVRNYLNRYTHTFGLRSLRQLSTRVQRVDRTPSSFIITTDSGTLLFDFVATCNGVFSQPHLLSIEGASCFAGQIIHSSQLSDPAILTGKRVLVIGAAKSGLDCPTLSSHHAAQTNILFRRALWMLPRYLPNGKTGESLFFNRFMGVFAPYHRNSPRKTYLHSRLPGLITARRRLKGKLISAGARYPRHMQPTEPLPGDYFSMTRPEHWANLTAERHAR